ncbi:MAG TPA: HAD-IIIC family phosphatase [Ktedonobacteraceae bacterium]|nr:HAD-IIIC family phosphatase [Ktedonobacteraceae bacterium]
MTQEQTPGVLIAETQPATKSIKCVVWDLDNTIWNGILLEDEHVTLRPDVVEVLETLDSRGILLSIASRNDHETAMRKLEEFGLKKYFLYPQINWNPKSSSIRAVAKSLNIGIDTFAFVDDQPFEREEVNFAIPEVLCIDAEKVSEICDLPEMMPRFITDDSHRRRQMYLSDIERNNVEKEFEGSNEEFLATLEMRFTIARAQEDDLRRAEELTVRTHQLNTTGYTYSYEELNAFRHSDKHKLFISGLEDRYGTYGKIGLTLVECQKDAWIVKLLLMSCRVMSRGVGTVMMNYIMNQARQANVRLLAEFVPNDRNRMMYITYKFGGFKEIERKDNLVVFEADLARIQPFPSYVTLCVDE